MPCGPKRRPTTTCPYRSIQRHTAQKPLFAVLIYYPHHPRAGERVFVVRTVHHAGVLHFVVDSVDGTRSLLPEWMTEPNAAKLPLVEAATLSLAALRALRAMIDGRPLSYASFTNAEEIGSHVGATSGSPTRPPRPGGTGCPPENAAARNPSDGHRSVEAAPERVRSGSDGGEAGQ